jgi:hypothetical protein
MTVTTVVGTIAAGQSLSAAINLTISAGQLVRMYAPPDWTSAPLTIQVSSDGVEVYRNLFQVDGKEFRIVVIPNSAILVSDAVGKGLAFIKLRSGTADLPIVQPINRDFKLVVST